LREESSDIKVGDNDVLRLPYVQLSDALDYSRRHCANEIHETRSHSKSRDSTMSPTV
jgi:hypothetical protein